jgi:hypothetical protein
MAQDDIREVFACKYRDGNDMNDLMSARDFYLSQAEDAEIRTPAAFVWVPITGSYDFDFLWFNNYDDLNAYGAGIDKRAGSADLQAIMARFASVADCSVSVSARTMVYAGGEQPVTEPPAFINTYACNFINDAGMPEALEMEEKIKEVLTEHDARKFILYRSVPITSRPGSADVYYYGVSGSAAAWAASETEINASESGQALNQHVASMLECRSNFFHGYSVVTPSE